MSRMRAPAVVAAATAIAATGASLAYVYFTGPYNEPPPPAPSPPLRAATYHHLSPPPDLPLSSKLPIVPDSNFIEPEPDITSQCDYGPFWECIVNGNGGCEVLEEDLRKCLAQDLRKCLAGNQNI